MSELERRRNARDSWVSRRHLKIWMLGSLAVVGVAFSLGYLLGQRRVRTAQLPAGHWEESVAPGESLLAMLAKVERVSSVSALGAVSYPRLLSGGEAEVQAERGGMVAEPTLADSLHPHPAYRAPLASSVPEDGHGVVATGFGSEDEVFAMAARLSALGFVARVGVERQAGEAAWGLYVGPFDTRHLALEARKSLAGVFSESETSEVDVVDFSADGQSGGGSDTP